MSEINSITDFNPGDIVSIEGFVGELALQSRLVEMGFVRGAQLRIVRYSPWKGSVELKIRNYHVALRLRDAQYIKVRLHGK